MAGKEGETTVPLSRAFFAEVFTNIRASMKRDYLRQSQKRSKGDTRKRKSSSSSPASFHLPSADLKTFFLGSGIIKKQGFWAIA